MSSDPRLILSGPVYTLLKDLAALRKARGKSSRLSVIGGEILADWLPAYIENEKAIARGEGSCVRGVMNWRNTQVDPHSQNTPPQVQSPQARGNRDKLQAFLRGKGD